MKVIVALDGSEESMANLQLTASMPFRDAELQLVTVTPTVDTSMFVAKSANAVSQIEAFNATLIEEAKALMKKGEQIVGEAGHRVSTVILSGETKHELMEHCKKARPDLISLGARGLNPISRLFLGSVSDYIVKHAECSVFISRLDNGKSIGAFPKKLKALVGYDNSDACKKAAQFLKEFDPKGIERISMASFVRNYYYYGMSYSVGSSDFWPELEQTVQKGLEETKEDLGQALDGVDISTDLYKDISDVASAINTRAVQDDMDMILVGNKSWNLFDRVLMGSVTTHLSHHCDKPLLIVR